MVNNGCCVVVGDCPKSARRFASAGSPGSARIAGLPSGAPTARLASRIHFNFFRGVLIARICLASENNHHHAAATAIQSPRPVLDSRHGLCAATELGASPDGCQSPCDARSPGFSTPPSTPPPRRRCGSTRRMVGCLHQSLQGSARVCPQWHYAASERRWCREYLGHIDCRLYGVYVVIGRRSGTGMQASLSWTNSTHT